MPVIAHLLINASMVATRKHTQYTHSCTLYHPATEKLVNHNIQNNIKEVRPDQMLQKSAAKVSGKFRYIHQVLMMLATVKPGLSHISFLLLACDMVFLHKGSCLFFLPNLNLNVNLTSVRLHTPVPLSHPQYDHKHASFGSSPLKAKYCCGIRDNGSVRCGRLLSSNADHTSGGRSIKQVLKKNQQYLGTRNTVPAYPRKHAT
jgi:hypothetical protein